MEISRDVCYDISNQQLDFATAPAIGTPDGLGTCSLIKRNKHSNAYCLDLTSQEPIASGQMRNVYEVPDLPNKLVKTIRPELVAANGEWIVGNRLKKRRPEGCYKVLVREISEYLIQSRKQYGKESFTLPIAHLYGTVNTTEGLGLITEKVESKDGELAPTFHHLKRSGKLQGKHIAALRVFLQRCRDEHLVCADVHAKNIVYTEGRTGRPECVCVDGFGEKFLVPIHRWSKRLNDRKLKRISMRLHRELGVGNLIAENGKRVPSFMRPETLLDISVKRFVAYSGLALICAVIYFSFGTLLGSDQDDLSATEMIEVHQSK